MVKDQNAGNNTRPLVRIQPSRTIRYSQEKGLTWKTFCVRLSHGYSTVCLVCDLPEIHGTQRVLPNALHADTTWITTDSLAFHCIGWQGSSRTNLQLRVRNVNPRSPLIRSGKKHENQECSCLCLFCSTCLSDGLSRHVDYATHAKEIENEGHWLYLKSGRNRLQVLILLNFHFRLDFFSWRYKVRIW